MRLGFFPAGLRRDLRSAGNIWLHAVSVGEVLASRQLIEGLRKAYPEKRLVISTVTPTGNKIAASIVQGKELVIYLPLDFSFIAKKVIDIIRPAMFIVAETEIWPNLISCLHRRRVPIITVNSRISDVSFKGYRCVRFLLAPVLNKIDCFCCQTQTDAKRLLALGVNKERIEITGNMKFDNTEYADKGTADKSILGPRGEEKLFVAGSTHPEEEEIILGAYKGLLGEFPYLKLLIAPRHPQRAEEIEKIIRKYGFNPVKVSQLDGGSAAQADRSTVFILDTIGQLNSFYAAADIVFVGGSLVKKGGHNILEPAFFAKPILFGPHMFNFRDMAGLFLEKNAAIQVKGGGELKERVKSLLNNPQEAFALGKRAKELLLHNKGATQRNLERIKDIISLE